MALRNSQQTTGRRKRLAALMVNVMRYLMHMRRIKSHDKLSDIMRQSTSSLVQIRSISPISLVPNIISDRFEVTDYRASSPTLPLLPKAREPGPTLTEDKTDQACQPDSLLSNNDESIPTDSFAERLRRSGGKRRLQIVTTSFSSQGIHLEDPFADPLSLRRKKACRDLRALYQAEISPGTVDPEPGCVEILPVSLASTPELEFPAKIADFIRMVDHFGEFGVFYVDSGEKRLACSTTNFQKWEHEVRDILQPDDAGGSPCGVFSKTEADGREHYYLIPFSRLLNPILGTNKYLLAPVVDLTLFVETAAAEDFDGSGDVDEDDFYRAISGYLNVDLDRDSVLSTREDLWTTIARECSQEPTSGLVLTPPGKSPAEHPPRSLADSPISLDRMLGCFSVELLDLYKDYFILTRPGLDSLYFEISEVSPALLADREFIDGHLMHTSVAARERLGVGLSQTERITMMVQWGEKGIPKRLYCVPLFSIHPESKSINDTTSSPQAWLCLLTNPELPRFWQPTRQLYFVPDA